MKKIFVMLVLVLLAIVFIAPNIISAKVASGFKNYLQSNDIIQLQQYGISLTLKEYQRGYFSSHASTKLIIINPIDKTLLLSTTLHYEFTHAPLSLSGIHLLTVEMNNAADFTGELAATLPAKLVRAQSHVSMLGNISQTVELSPVSIYSRSLPVSQFATDGLNIHWHSHLSDFPRNGHGYLDSPAIVLQTRQNETFNISHLQADLAITNQQKKLTINEFSVDYQPPDDQSIKTSIARIEQIQLFDKQGDAIVPLAHTLAINDLIVTYNAQPQLTIHSLQGSVGVKKTDAEYELGLDWISELTINPARDTSRFPWLATLPTEQAVSIHLSPIKPQQFDAWSSLLEVVAQPTSPPLAMVNTVRALITL